MARKRYSVHQTLIVLFFAVVCLAIFFPFFLMAVASVTAEKAILSGGFRLFPEPFSLDAYKLIFRNSNVLLNSYLVTILVTVTGTVCSLLLTAMTAYPIARRDYRYNRGTTFYIFFTMLFSGGLVPFYILMTQYLELKDTILALILPLLLSPYNIMIMKGFLDKMPMEIIESGKMDGASETRLFFTMVLPLSTPALATLGLFIAFAYWNDWFNALLFIDKPSLVPVQLLLARIINQIEFLANSPMSAGLVDTSQFPTLSTRMAMAILAGGPMLVIFPFFQKYFVKGITVGSLKG